MADIAAWVYDHTNGTLTIRCPGKDFTGHDVELRLCPHRREPAIVLSTLDDTLSLDLPDGLVDVRLQHAQCSPLDTRRLWHEPFGFGALCRL